VKKKKRKEGLVPPPAHAAQGPHQTAPGRWCPASRRRPASCRRQSSRGREVRREVVLEFGGEVDLKSNFVM